MEKDTSEDESSRFVWKRNPNYDVCLVSEIESRNPYSSKNEKPTWIQIAKVLQEGPLKMKVTDRSCRERAKELLKKHRKNELASIRASGISEGEMSVLKTSLTSVAKLQEAKPNKQLKALYTREDRAAAELIRSTALEKVGDSDSSVEENRKRKSEKQKQNEDEDFDFSLKRGRSGLSNPKNQLINFLQKKSKEEITLRKQELTIREREAENKAKEVEIMQLKVEAEIEERKKFTELLVKLATPTPPQ